MSIVNENYRKILDNLSAVTEKLGFAGLFVVLGVFV